MSNFGWEFSDKHVSEQAIGKEDFTSASRCIIYASASKIENGPNNTKVLKKDGYKRIGVIQGYNWGEQKQLEMIFELGSDIPYIIPGRTTGQISISRMLLFGRDIVNVLHYGSDDTSESDPTSDFAWLRSLKDINTPLDLAFVMYKNTANNIEANNSLENSYSRLFKNCWIQSRNESITAGQVLIAENVTIMYEQVANVEVITENNT